MRIDSRFLNWGVFFILLGAIPLAIQANALDRDVAARSWQLWPLLIVGGGVGLLLRRTSFDFAGGLIVAATFGLIFGGLLAAGADAGIGACGNGAVQPFAAQQGALSNGSVNVEFNCGDLSVNTAAGNSWALTGSSHDRQLPRIDSSAAQLDLRSRDEGFGFLGFGTQQAWTVTLPQDPLLDVELHVNAGRGNLGFGGSHLGTLDIQGNAGSVRIDLGTVAAIQRINVRINAGSARIILPDASLTGNFEANAGSIAFCVPESTGIRVTAADNLTASNNFAAQGLTKSGNTWETSNYASATNRIGLTTNANAASITLNPKDGCR